MQTTSLNMLAAASLVLAVIELANRRSNAPPHPQAFFSFVAAAALLGLLSVAAFSALDVLTKLLLPIHGAEAPDFHVRDMLWGLLTVAGAMTVLLGGRRLGVPWAFIVGWFVLGVAGLLLLAMIPAALGVTVWLYGDALALLRDASSSLFLTTMTALFVLLANVAIRPSRQPARGLKGKDPILPPVA